MRGVLLFLSLGCATLALSACVSAPPLGYVKTIADERFDYDRSKAVAVTPRTIGDPHEKRASRTVRRALLENGIPVTGERGFAYVLQVERRVLDGAAAAAAAPERPDATVDDAEWRMFTLRLWDASEGTTDVPMIWTGAIVGDGQRIDAKEEAVLRALVDRIGTTTDDQGMVPLEENRDRGAQGI